MRLITIGLLLLWGSAMADNKDIMKVTPGATQFTIELPSNPTTGYQWSLDTYNKKLLSLQSSQFIRPQTGLMGAAGTMQFVFELHPDNIYPIETCISFNYARPWEKQAVKSKTVTIQFSDAP